MARSASSPFVATVKYEPASAAGPRASNTSAAMPACCNAMAVTGPQTPAPTINAFMANLRYN